MKCRKCGVQFKHLKILENLSQKKCNKLKRILMIGEFKIYKDFPKKEKFNSKVSNKTI